MNFKVIPVPWYWAGSPPSFCKWLFKAQPLANKHQPLSCHPENESLQQGIHPAPPCKLVNPLKTEITPAETIDTFL